jgi:hypothetical protein
MIEMIVFFSSPANTFATPSIASTSVGYWLLVTSNWEKFLATYWLDKKILPHR